MNPWWRRPTSEEEEEPTAESHDRQKSGSRASDARFEPQKPEASPTDAPRAASAESAKAATPAPKRPSPPPASAAESPAGTSEPTRPSAASETSDKVKASKEEKEEPQASLSGMAYGEPVHLEDTLTAGQEAIAEEDEEEDEGADQPSKPRRRRSRRRRSSADRDEPAEETAESSKARSRGRSERDDEKEKGDAAAEPKSDSRFDTRKKARRSPAAARAKAEPNGDGEEANGVAGATELAEVLREVLASVPHGTAPADERKIALFCDLENIAIGVRDSEIKKFDVNLVLERLLEKGKIIVKKAYADWERYSEYKRGLHGAAIEMIDIPQKYYSGKNSADIKMVVDAMDLCYSKEHLDTFVVLSGDSDFSPLVSKLKENNKYVIGVGVKKSSSNLLIDNCDEFIYYEDLWRESQEAPEVDGLTNEQSEAFGLMVDSIKALQRENKDVLWGSMIKQTMQRKRPSFNEGYHGYGSFSDLLEDAEKNGLVDLKKDRNSGSYIVTRLRKKRR